MTTQRDSRFFQWFDAVTSEAADTLIGKTMATAGYVVTHTGGGCLAWEKAAEGCNWCVWICEEDSGLGTDESESATIFGAMLNHVETGDFINGPVKATLAECIAWGDAELADTLNGKHDAVAACRHRNDGRGRCIDCGAFL